MSQNYKRGNIAIILSIVVMTSLAIIAIIFLIVNLRVNLRVKLGTDLRVDSSSASSGYSDGYVGKWKNMLDTNKIYDVIGLDAFNFAEFTLEQKSEPNSIRKQLKLFDENAPLIIPLSIKDRGGKRLNAGIYDSKYGHIFSYWAKAARIDCFIRLEDDRLYWGVYRNAASLKINNKYHLDWEKIDDGINVFWVPYERSDE